MLRQIIKIDKEKCTGCGLCVSACHEGAIGLKDGKAALLKHDHCDGLGNCLPVCPTGAISLQERQAQECSETLPCGCPGTNSKAIKRDETRAQGVAASELRQWPVQIKLVPENAPYFENANLLVSADCCAYAYGNFHNDFMKNKITIIGCPKLDDGDYSEKLTAILKTNNIKSVTVIRMEVPCCSGIKNAVITALKDCGKMIPWQAKTISTDGNSLD